MNNTTESLLVASDASIVRTFEPTRCLLCDQFLHINTGVILRDCFHIFCDRCLIRTIKATIFYSAQVHCPAEINGGCTTLLQEREIRGLLSGEDYRKYEQKCMELVETEAATDVHCFTPRCKGKIEITGFVSIFKCPVCSSINCMNCKAVHSGISCMEFQAQKSLLHNRPDGSNLRKLKPKPTIDLEQLRTASDAVLARNLYTSKCPVCDDDVPINGGVILRDCFHIFCDECLIGTIKATLDEGAEVQCPALFDDGQGCSTVVQEREIKCLLKAEEYEKFEQRCLNVAEDGIATSVHCVAPDCKGWVVLTGIIRIIESFQCPVCSSDNCLACKAIHPQKSCNEYQTERRLNGEEGLSDDKIKSMLASHEAVRCPNCTRLITKNGGCDHMTCIKCKHEFYWSTLAAYRR